MKRYGSIYLIKNKLNGMTYVGQTIQSVEKRWSYHIKNKNTSIISKVLKNNFNNFEFIELISCFSKEDLNYWEKNLIKTLNTLYPSGYNLTSGGNEYNFTDIIKEKMRNAKLGKNINNHAIKINAKNIQTSENLVFNSLRDACKLLSISRSSILKSCKYNIVRKNYIFSYANQSGSTKENFEHAQRLEGETDKVNNPSTSPRFPKKYMDNKELILQLSEKISPYSISKKLNLDKSMVCYFIHVFREKR